MTAKRPTAGETRQPPAPRNDPTLAHLLRQIALHQETAALLDQRAQNATSPAQATVLRQRAAARRAIAQQLRQQLGAEWRAGRPEPGLFRADHR